VKTLGVILAINYIVSLAWLLFGAIWLGLVGMAIFVVILSIGLMASALRSRT
jgi:hypothetical protein